MNTCESNLILHDEENMRKLCTAAQQAVEYLQLNKLNEANIVDVVIEYKMKRGLYFQHYVKVLVSSQKAVWRIMPLRDYFLCSNGQIYMLKTCKTFGDFPRSLYMPLESIERSKFDELFSKLKTFKVNANSTKAAKPRPRLLKWTHL